MHRFYVAPGTADSEELILTGAEAHHALHVVRVRRGEQVVVLNGAGLERLCEVLRTEGNGVHLRILEKRSIPPLPYQITLIQALPKGKLFEAIIQKATELGAIRIVPLLSERVVAHLDEEGAAHKADKWQTVALEAIKQCGAPWLPKVDAPLKLASLLEQKNAYDLMLVGSLQPGAQHPRKYLLDYERTHGRKPESICVWIGPEGDFTRSELQTIEQAGALPITLGRLVLRTETAAIYCLSFLNYELQAR